MLVDHKSGSNDNLYSPYNGRNRINSSNEYKNNKHNTKLTLSVRVYQQTHNGQRCIRMCLQSELSTELHEAKNLVFNLLNRTISNSNLNTFWQYFTISVSIVLNSFIKIDLYAFARKQLPRNLFALPIGDHNHGYVIETHGIPTPQESHRV